MNRFDKTGRTPRSPGFALVIILSFLVLIIVVVLAFFSNVTNEYRTTKTFSNQVACKQLADSAVQLVMGQIKNATTQGGNIAWASQPGMIRTYGASATVAGSAALNCYKLYSSDVMQVRGATFDPSADMDGQWNQKPALFSDLNSPVVDREGNTCFPILDPRAYTGGAGSIDGFSYTAQTTAGTSINGVTLPGASGTQKLPMPVKWLYLLKDGTLTAPAGVDATGKIANWDGKAAYQKPNAENPIVGRVAFWTDDETCKINVNTAGEGVYWDMPRYGGMTPGNGKEVDYSIYQPRLYEFQRYPGHPAGVALSPVLSPLTGVTDAAQLATIAANITPKLAPGGSKGGTVAYNDTSAQTINLANAVRQALYGSVDELMFANTMNGSQRAQTQVAASGVTTLTKAQLRAAEFFLTASSRAPEVNLYGQPRISIWPVHKDLASNLNSPYTTGIDRLIAFQSTLLPTATAPLRYYFQREDALSPVNDYKNIARNRDLYQWLQTLTNRAIPGFGGTFSAKYPQDRDQILTEIFDYIRATNFFDINLQPAGNPWQTPSVYPYAPMYKISQTNYGGVVAPIKIDSTKGFGRQYSLTEVGLCFICTGDGALVNGGVNPSNDTSKNPSLEGVKLETNQKRYQIALLFESAPTMYGPAVSGMQDLVLQVSHLEDLTINGTKKPFDGLFSSSGYTRDDPGGYLRITESLRSWGYLNGPNNFMWQNNGGNMFMSQRAYAHASPTDTKATVIYPYISKPFTVTGNTMDVSGPSIVTVDGTSFAGLQLTVKLYQGQFCNAGSKNEIPVSGNRPQLSSVVANPDNLIQTINLFFPQMPAMPTPSLSDSSDHWGYAQRVNDADPIDPKDVVQSLVIGSGDWRMVAGRQKIQEGTLFAVADGYGVNKLATLFKSGASNLLASGENPSGTVGGISVDIPAKLNSTNLPDNTGDWDGPPGVAGNGAYLNMPDIGDQQDQTTSGYYPYYWANSNNVVVSATSYYTPNRLIPSPGMFGSLPTGVLSNAPWQTLLFRPQRNHPQSAQSRPLQPPDHLIMDLFWMPVAEPYAISDSLSTAGKINMNYQIVPFTHINRHTALNAVLKGERMISVPNTSGYKGTTKASYRFKINADETTGSLRQFREKFNNRELFKSATEICDIYLVPGAQEQPSSGPATPSVSAQSWSSNDTAETYWNSHAYTSDNARERVYTTLYPKLTTKSNTYTVHYRAQSLQKVPSTSAEQWVDNKDQVTGEMRGSAVIERYVDPNDTRLPDFATTASSDTLDAYYRFHILSSNRFSP